MWIALGAVALAGLRWLVERMGHAVLTWHKARSGGTHRRAARESTESGSGVWDDSSDPD